MNPSDLIGKLYPIKDENNNIVFYKLIQEAYHLENVAAFAIRLENGINLIALPFKQALELTKEA
jgi:hypothetical protein